MSPAMPDTGLTQDYLHALSEEEKRYTDKIINGHPKTLEDYRESVGVIKGLRLAGHLLHDTIKSYEQLQDYGDENEI